MKAPTWLAALHNTTHTTAAQALKGIAADGSNVIEHRQLNDRAGSDAQWWQSVEAV